MPQQASPGYNGPGYGGPGYNGPGYGGPGGPGFEVDPEAVRRGGRTACDLASALATVRSTWAAATDNPGDACGLAETTAEYGRTQDAWFDELGVHIRVLEELCQAIQAAAGDYRSADDAAADRTRGPV